MNLTRRPNLQMLGGAAALFVLALIVYSPCLTLGFVFDDGPYLLKNDPLQGAHAFHDIWFSTRLLNYYPVFFSVLRCEWNLWGINPWGYHLVNLLLHSFCTASLYLLLRRLRVAGAWVIALLFALHPLNAQTVAWIVEQKNTLSLLFLIPAAAIFCPAPEPNTAGNQHTGASPPMRWSSYAAGLILFMLSVLSKSSVVMFPVFFTGLWWWQGRLTNRRAMVQLAGLFALSVAFGLGTIWFEDHRVQVGTPLGAIPIPQRLLMAGAVLGAYARLALFPARLALFYAGWAPEEQTHQSFIPNAAWIAVTVLWFILARRHRGSLAAAFAGYFYFAVMLLPFAGFLQTNFFHWSLIADHWVYHALPGLLLATVQLVILATKGLPASLRLVRPVLAAACACWFASVTWAQIPVHRDEVALAEYGIERNPRAWLCWYNLGTSLDQRLQRDNAIRAYQQALSLRPDYFWARYNLASDLLAAGQYSASESQYRKALEAEPESWEAYANLGVLFLRMNEPEKARKCLEQAIAIEPSAPGPNKNLAILEIRAGEYDKAAPHLERTWAGLGGDSAILSTLEEARKKFGSSPKLDALLERAQQLSGAPKHL